MAQSSDDGLAPGRAALMRDAAWAMVEDQIWPACRPGRTERTAPAHKHEAGCAGVLTPLTEIDSSIELADGVTQALPAVL